MNVRCADPSHMAYKSYGGRGIKVCDAWNKLNPDGTKNEKGFENWLNFMGPAPTPQHSIDRVDNDVGYMPYHPVTGKVQVRWATAKEQRANQRPKEKQQ